jgi:hypothetical protein
MAGMVDDILSQISPEELAQQLGTDPDTAMDAVRKALPALAGAMSGNVQAGGGEALGAAIQRDHDGSLLDAPQPLAAVDTTDGARILEHVLGSRRGEVEQTLGSTSKADSSIFSRLLPMLAPLVMAWLGKRLGGGGATASQADAGGGLGDVLGDLMGGGAAAGTGGGLGSILGDLLGGEVSQSRSSMPDLGGLFDMLGGGSAHNEGAGGGAAHNEGGRAKRQGDVPDVGDLLG